MKKYFIVISIFAIASFIYVGILGNNQRTKNGEDFLNYEKHMKMVDKNSGLKEALKVVEYMQTKEEKENYIFNIDKAKIYLKMKHIDKSQQEYKKAIENNITLGKDVVFLTDYAEVALKNKDYKKSKELIDKVKSIGVTDKVNKRIDYILSKIV